MSTPIFWQGELMLAAWTNSHRSGPKLTFAADVDALEAFCHLTTKDGTKAGQRFAAVFVLLGDDEQPKSVQAPSTLEEARALAPSAKPGPLCIEAVQLCSLVRFWDFCEQAHPEAWWRGLDRASHKGGEGKEQAARYVLLALLGVQSRKEIDADEVVKGRFIALRAAFWKFRAEQEGAGDVD